MTPLLEVTAGQGSSLGHRFEHRAEVFGYDIATAEGYERTLSSFHRMVNDRRYRGIPLVMETPGPLAEWKKEIGRIRGPVAPRPARKRATRRR